jgi:outer membrane protein
MRFVAMVAAGLVGLSAHAVSATDLVEAWRAAERNGLELLSARQAKAAGDARRAQASSLWHPSVQFTGTAGVANSNTATTGAQFSALAFGISNNVAFNTSVNGGTTGRWALEARQPLFSGERDAQKHSLQLSSDVAETEWQGARQALILRTAERYFDVVQAAESLRVLQRQQAAVDKALVEVRDRYTLGDIPVTDTHEAVARSESIRAQVLAAETELEVKRMTLAEATGLDARQLRVISPARTIPSAPGETLDQWIADTVAGNPQLRAQMTGVEIAREEASRHSLKAATSVDIVAQLARDRISGSGDFGSASTTTSSALVGVQLVVPIYTGGYRSAKQDEALSLAAKALTDAEHTRQQVALRARAAWLALAAGSGRLAALEQSLKATRSRLDATRLAQQIGDRTTLDLLNSENDAAAAELAVMQARITLLLDRMRLARLAGKLDESVLQAVNATLADSP